MRPHRGSIVPTAFLAVLLTLVGSFGCAANDLGTLNGGDDSGAVDDGVNPNGPPAGNGGTSGDGMGTAPTPVYSGVYELTSIVDLAGAGAFGPTISGTLVQLSMFHDHPAATILNLMALYNTPYFAQVWNVLPGFIKDEVTKLLDQLIVQALFDNIPVIDKAAELISDIGNAGRNVELVTDMTLRRPTTGAANALRGEHVMKSLGFHLWGGHAEIPLPSSFQQITQLEVRAALTVVQGGMAGDPQAKLVFSKQNFAIPYGAMIMDAIKELVFVPAGATSLSTWLNKLINCGSIGRSLAGICVLGACVSDLVSADSMANFCSSGLGILGDVVETAVRSLKIELADLTNGKCELYDKGYADTRGDGKMDAVSNGSWDMMIKIGGQAKSVKAPFDGKRIGD